MVTEYKNAEIDLPLVEHERDAWKARALALTIYADELRDRIRDAFLEADSQDETTESIDATEEYCRLEHERQVHLMPGAQWPVEKA